MKLPNARVLLSVTSLKRVVTVTGVSAEPNWLLVKVALPPLTEPAANVTPVKVTGLLLPVKSPDKVPPVMLSPELALAPPSRLVPLLVNVQQLLVTRPFTWPPVRLIAPLLVLRLPLTCVPLVVIAPCPTTLPLTWLVFKLIAPLPLLTAKTEVPLRLTAPEADTTAPWILLVPMASMLPKLVSSVIFFAAVPITLLFRAKPFNAITRILPKPSKIEVDTRRSSPEAKITRPVQVNTLPERACHDPPEQGGGECGLKKPPLLKV